MELLIEIARIAPIFDTVEFWAVVSGIAPIFLVFLFIAMTLAKVKSALWGEILSSLVRLGYLRHFSASRQLSPKAVMR